jgi:hypothetical protein
MFTITRGTGFTIGFPNGWSISVQFGNGTYCENRYRDHQPHAGFYSSPDAEVAVFKPDGSFARLCAHDDVAGWQTPEQVAELIAQVAAGTFVEATREAYATD